MTERSRTITCNEPSTLAEAVRTLSGLDLLRRVAAG